MPYDDTEVSVLKSQEQIKNLLKGHKVERIRYSFLPSVAIIEFIYEEKETFLPYQVTLIPKIRKRSFERGYNQELERAERQVWRMAYWWLKAKMEAVEFGLTTFQEEMLPWMLVQGAPGKPPETLAKVLFSRWAGALPAGGKDDPFGGIMPQLNAPEEVK